MHSLIYVRQGFYTSSLHAQYMYVNASIRPVYMRLIHVRQGF